MLSAKSLSGSQIMTVSLTAVHKKQPIPTFLPSKVHRKHVVTITNLRVCPMLEEGTDGLSSAPQCSHMQGSDTIVILPVDDGSSSQQETEDSGGGAVGCQVKEGGALLIKGGVDSLLRALREQQGNLPGGTRAEASQVCAINTSSATHASNTLAQLHSTTEWWSLGVKLCTTL